MPSSALERFLRYAAIDTRSDERSTSAPSTEGQLVLQRLLVDELRALGIADAALDEHGYVMATIPALAGCEAAPTIGFIAHVDTSPEMPGRDVRPIVHRAWDGRDIVLPDDPSAVLRPDDIPDLSAHLGHDIVTASGLTLLGGDDKAGVAAILAAAEHLMRHPEAPRGRVRLAFTPDEEIGRGADHFEVAAFDAVAAYTMDGGAAGELEYESFSADAMTVAFTGFNTHPGYAKGRMINAIKLAADFIARLPRDGMSPEMTEGYEGFVHPYVVEASVERTSVRLLIRDFATSALRTKEAFVERLAREVVAGAPGSSVECTVAPSYRNMREVLDGQPLVVQKARDAMLRVGLTPIERPIRGGTDGARLSFMGLPTPNLFAGQHNFHSRLEWVCAHELDQAVELIVALCGVWTE